MNSQDFKQSQTTSYALPVYVDGYYNESVVVNHTKEPITVIHPNGERITINPPDTHVDHNQCVEIHHRHAVHGRQAKGATMSKVNEAPITTDKYIIPYTNLKSEPLHVRELGFTLVPCSIAHQVKSPYEEQDFSSSVSEAVETLVNNDGCCTVRVVVNDPAGEHRNLWWQFLSERIQIPIYNYEADEATVQFIISREHVIQNIITRPLSDITDESSGYVVFNSGFVLNMAPTESRLQKGLDETRHFGETDNDLDELLKKRDNEWKEKIENMKEDHKQEIEKLKRQLSEQEEAKKAKESEIEYYRNLVSRYEAGFKHFEQQANRATNEEKHEGEKWRTDKAREQYKSEIVKNWAAILKTVASIGIPAASFIYTVVKERQRANE